MDLAQQADNIAMTAITENAGTGLRALSPTAREQRVHDCLDELTQLLGSELDSDGLLRFAAAATYRANYNLACLLTYQNSLDLFLTELDAADKGGKGRTEKIKVGIAKLRRQGHPLVSIAIARAQAAGASLSASSSGSKGKAKTNQVRDYAVRRYLQGKWANPSQARHALWPDVQAEAKRLGTALSVTRGPITLYEWLRKAKKSTTSTS